MNGNWKNEETFFYLRTQERVFSFFNFLRLVYILSSKFSHNFLKIKISQKKYLWNFFYKDSYKRENMFLCWCEKKKYLLAEYYCVSAKCKLRTFNIVQLKKMRNILLFFFISTCFEWTIRTLNYVRHDELLL
jgi:hypothetical protein